MKKMQNLERIHGYQKKVDPIVTIAIAIGIVFSVWLLWPYMVPDATAIIPKEAVVQQEEPQIVDEPNEIDEEEVGVEEQDEVNEETTTLPSTTYGGKEFEDRCRLTYAESGLEPEEGQVAVAATILNRQYSSEFKADGDFYKTMNNGFSSVRNGEIYIMTSNPYVLDYEDVPEKTIRATERALNGEDPTEQLLWEEAVRLGLDPEVYAAGGAKFFYNPNACSEAALAERASIKCKVQIGNHIFYKVWDQ